MRVLEVDDAGCEQPESKIVRVQNVNARSMRVLEVGDAGCEQPESKLVRM
jgi:hypothetical protein